MKRFSVFLPLVLTLAVLIISIFVWKEITAPISGSTALKSFVISKGDNAETVGENLYKEGLIKSPLAFKFYTQLTNKSKLLLAGDYQLSPSLSLEEIVRELENGPIEVRVTIPEGLRREEIAARFIKEFSISNPVKIDMFMNEFMTASNGKEGYLFPDTYVFSRTASVSSIVDKLSETFDLKTASLEKENTRGSLSWNEVIILASIIERETKDGPERPIVAGILEKRLANDWALQTDATIQYGVATVNCKMVDNCNWWPNLTKANLDINSPYNTYQNKGLPPTPISNPGLSSIAAVVHPQASDYWFYLHDSNGNIHYAVTGDEQIINVSKYLGN